MGKKKKGAVCNNPVAMARASGPPPVTGPTIRDYLARDRPSLEEATALLQSKGKESGPLAAYEEQMNDQYREELRKHRERILGGRAGESSRSRSSDKKAKRKKKKKSHVRSRSRSRSRSSSPHHRKKSKKKRGKDRRHYSSSSDDESDSNSDDHRRSKAVTRTESSLAINS